MDFRYGFTELIYQKNLRKIKQLFFISFFIQKYMLNRNLIIILKRYLMNFG